MRFFRAFFRSHPSEKTLINETQKNLKITIKPNKSRQSSPDRFDLYFTSSFRLSISSLNFFTSNSCTNPQTVLAKCLLHLSERTPQYLHFSPFQVRPDLALFPATRHKTCLIPMPTLTPSRKRALYFKLQSANKHLLISSQYQSRSRCLLPLLSTSSHTNLIMPL